MILPRESITLAVPPVLLEGESGGFLGDTLPQVLFLMGGLLLMFLVVRLSSRKLQQTRQLAEIERQVASGKKGGAVGKAREQAVMKSPPRGNSELEKLYVDLEQFTREVEGRLDTKIVYLRGLLREADRAAERLEALVEAAPESPVPAGAVPEESVEGPAVSRPEPRTSREVPAGEAEDEEAILGTRLDVLAGEPGDRLGLAGAETGTGKGSSEDPAGRIWALHLEGKASREIAELTGLPKGEVELMINLRQSEQVRGEQVRGEQVRGERVRGDGGDRGD